MSVEKAGLPRINLIDTPGDLVSGVMSLIDFPYCGKPPVICHLSAKRDVVLLSSFQAKFYINRMRAKDDLSKEGRSLG